MLHNVIDRPGDEETTAGLVRGELYDSPRSAETIFSPYPFETMVHLKVGQEVMRELSLAGVRSGGPETAGMREDKAELYDKIIRKVERPLITLVLQMTRGNQCRAAALLGINRNTLRKKIKDLDIDPGTARKSR